jgi:hypothetical protein
VEGGRGGIEIGCNRIENPRRPQAAGAILSMWPYVQHPLVDAAYGFWQDSIFRPLVLPADYGYWIVAVPGRIFQLTVESRRTSQRTDSGYVQTNQIGEGIARQKARLREKALQGPSLWRRYEQ